MLSPNVHNVSRFIIASPLNTECVLYSGKLLMHRNFIQQHIFEKVLQKIMLKNFYKAETPVTKI